MFTSLTFCAIAAPPQAQTQCPHPRCRCKRGAEAHVAELAQTVGGLVVQMAAAGGRQAEPAAAAGGGAAPLPSVVLRSALVCCAGAPGRKFFGVVRKQQQCLKQTQNKNKARPPSRSGERGACSCCGARCGMTCVCAAFSSLTGKALAGVGEQLNNVRIATAEPPRCCGVRAWAPNAPEHPRTHWRGPTGQEPP